MQKPQTESRPDGLTLITVEMPQAETITASLMFRAGSRYEAANKWGLAHFFEHMLFHGTAKYPTSKDLTNDIDTLGAIQNAYTWNEVISMWIKGSKNASDKIFEIIAEESIHPLLPEEAIAKEHKIVMEEYHMNYNDHDSWLGREWERWLLCDQKAALDPLGREENIKSFSHQDVLGHFQLFSPRNGISVVAGNISHDQHRQLADKYYRFKNDGALVSDQGIDAAKLSPEKVLLISRKEMTQATIQLGTSISGIDDADVPALRVLNAVLSGGMSTRLFQEIREKRNLCYNIGSSGVFFSDFGLWSVDGGMNVDNVDKAVSLILEELRQIREDRVPDEELQKAKTNLRGRVSIAAENTQFVSDLYARYWLATGKVKTIEESLNENDQVTADEILTVAQKYLHPNRLRLGVIGPFDDKMKNNLERIMNKE